MLPKAALATGTQITAEARVFFAGQPPADTPRIVQRIDGAAPRSTVTATPLAAGAANYSVTWQADDDDGGSGVKHVTVYVADNGGDFRIWLQQTTATSAVYTGQSGHTYEFLTVATDNAGNREPLDFGIVAPDDGSTVNLGYLPDVGQTQAPDLAPAPASNPSPSVNTLFLQAQLAIPTAPQFARPADFDTIVQPFRMQAFATGFAQSAVGIGPLAIVERPDGSIIVSGGAVATSCICSPATAAPLPPPGRRSRIPSTTWPSTRSADFGARQAAGRSSNSIPATDTSSHNSPTA